MIESLLNFRNRRLVLVLAVVGFIACSVVSAQSPNVGIRPLATVCIIVIALISEAWVGFVAAIAGSILLTWIGIVVPWSTEAARNPVTALIFLGTNVLGVIFAVALRNQVANNAALESRVIGAEIDRRRLIELENTRAELEESERRYKTVGEFIPFGIWQTDAEDRIVYMSQSLLDMLGMTLDELIMRGWLDRVPAEDAERFRKSWRRKDENPGMWECQYRILGGDGRLYTIQSRGTRLLGASGEIVGWIGVNYDASKTTQALERLDFLAEAGRLLSLSLDPETTLDRIASLSVPRLADWCAIETVQDDGTLKPVALKHIDPERIGWALEMQRRYPSSPDSPTGPYAVAKTGQPQLIEEVTDQMLVVGARDAEHLQLLRQVGMRSGMMVPLIARGRCLGVATFVTSESKRRYDASDLDFASILGRRAALAYDNALLFAKEQKVAETFQAASLPTRLPEIPGLKISATYRAARNEAEVGGDWYDAFELPSGQLVVTIGDVAGKGLKAAVAMSAVRQFLWAAAFEGVGPADMLRRCNRVVCYQEMGVITAAVGVLDPESHSFSFATAGHPPLLYVDAQGTLHRMSTPGLPLGVLPDFTYSEETRRLDDRGLLVFHTDGLTEFRRDITYGERALADAVIAHAGVAAPNVADSIVRSTVEGSPPDDIAVLAITFLSERFNELDLSVPAVPASARVVRRGLRRLCIANDLSEDQTFRVLVAAGEAISNVIEHAYSAEAGTVRVKGYPKDHSLVIEISDEGRWRMGKRYHGGRGLELMRRLMDEVSVESNGGGTMVRQRIDTKEEVR